MNILNYIKYCSLNFFFFFFCFSISLFVLSHAHFYPIICFKILPKTEMNRKRKLYLFSYYLKNRGKFSYSALLFSKVIGESNKTKQIKITFSIKACHINNEGLTKLFTIKSAQSLVCKVLGLQNVPFGPLQIGPWSTGLHGLVCRLYPTQCGYSAANCMHGY